jgi:Ni/Co efflux regulator RcnB
MKNSRQQKLAFALFVTGTFAISPVFADKPDWAGNGKVKREVQESHKGDSRGGDDRRGDHRDDQGRDNRGDARTNHFDDHHRIAVREYYDESFRTGRCPPGLAKKHNGCLPPGQAKRWNKGRPLPRDVIYYDLPPSVVVRLGSPPKGHKYVRVAGDILLIAIGTGMVIDAIQDITR